MTSSKKFNFGVLK